MSEPLRKIAGGEPTPPGACYMPDVALTEAHIAALRDGTMSDRWFDNLADQLWKAARAQYIERMKRTLRAHAAMQLPSVDRRPSRLALVGGGGA